MESRIKSNYKKKTVEKTKAEIAKERELQSRLNRYAIEAHNIENLLIRLFIRLEQEEEALESAHYLKGALNDIKKAARLLASGK